MKQLTTNYLTASSLLLASAAQAQITVSIAPKVGETLSKMRVEGDGHTDHRYGFAAGAQVYVGWGRFALQPALLYAQQGYKYTQQVPYSSNGSAPVLTGLTTTQRLNYLTLPLNFTFAPAGTASGPQFYAGPYVSVLLGGQHELQAANGALSQSDPIYVGDNADIVNRYYARRVDAGFQAGLGFRADQLLLQIDYSLGLRSTVTTSSYLGSAVKPAAMYNSSFLFAASYLFDLTR